MSAVAYLLNMQRVELYQTRQRLFVSRLSAYSVVSDDGRTAVFCLDAADVPRLLQGSTVLLKDCVGSGSHVGTVTSAIIYESQNQVIITVRASDNLESGQALEMSVETVTLNAFAVPRTALLMRGTANYVYVYANGTLTRRFVLVDDDYNGSMVAVIYGLSEGECVAQNAADAKQTGALYYV